MQKREIMLQNEERRNKEKQQKEIQREFEIVFCSNPWVTINIFYLPPVPPLMSHET